MFEGMDNMDFTRIECKEEITAGNFCTGFRLKGEFESMKDPLGAKRKRNETNSKKDAPDPKKDAAPDDNGNGICEI